jgi:hypothetical protein
MTTPQIGTLVIQKQEHKKPAVDKENFVMGRIVK